MKVKENTKAPTFKLSGTKDTKFDLKKIKGKLIIYFYPKDDTPGCTIETKDFSKLYIEYYRKRHGLWRLYGLNLPDEILKKVYYQNALKIFPNINPNLFK